jgi:hypothetical protein
VVAQEAQLTFEWISLVGFLFGKAIRYGKGLARHRSNCGKIPNLLPHILAQ